MTRTDESVWFVIHVPSGAQRQVVASSAALAIFATGWPALECIAQQSR